MGPTVADIKQRLHEADEREFAVLERSLVADARKGVRDAVERARARLAAEAAERQRLASLYAFERALAAGRGDGVIVGLDEVGRGPLPGLWLWARWCCPPNRSSRASTTPSR